MTLPLDLTDMDRVDDCAADPTEAKLMARRSRERLRGAVPRDRGRGRGRGCGCAVLLLRLGVFVLVRE